MGSKNYVLVTFGSHARITLQKSSQNYVMKLRSIYVRKLRNKTIQMKTKIA